MRLDPECVGCIINQSVRVASAIEASPLLAQKLKSYVEDASRDFDFSQTPPEVASSVYEGMARLAGMDDLYAKAKESATQKALSLIPSLEQKIATCKNPLLTATKIAVAGNVIDLAAAIEFDLHEELEKIFETPFATDDFSKLEAALPHAKTIVYLGDNAGEHIFDKLYIQTLRLLYPHAKIYYFVRGNPIINDVTMQEALACGLDSVCEVVDSGVNTPGFIFERATPHAKELFMSADLVLSKGMGNYESLSPAPRGDIVFLLKVKCQVVANSLSLKSGDIVCKFV